MSAHDSTRRAPLGDTGTLASVVAVVLGLLVAVLGFLALMMWSRSERPPFLRTVDGIRRLFTTLVRSDRFVEGHSAGRSSRG